MDDWIGFKANTSRPGNRPKTYPYLLKRMGIEHSNQVWAADICYMAIRRTS